MTKGHISFLVAGLGMIHSSESPSLLFLSLTMQRKKATKVLEFLLNVKHFYMHILM